MTTFLAFIGAIVVLVAFHEYGHYFVARLCGVKVLRFSIGFGKILYTKKFAGGETEWSISAIPLGGYVKMLDEREGVVKPEDLPRTFNRQPVLRRMAIVVAGPLANLLLAIVFYWGLFIYGVPGLKPIIGNIAPATPAAAAQLQAQQTIVSINGTETPSWQVEKTTAENQRGQIGLQLNQLQQDIELLQLQFQLLLNTNIAFVPNEKDFRINVLAKADSSLLLAHPIMQYLKQQQQIAAAATQVEKSKLLPNLTLGYNIMGIRGTGANNKEYNSTPRFQSVQIGLGIPIFTSGQKAKINAAKTYEKVVENEYEVNRKNFETAYKSALVQYQKYSEAITYFETTALKNADLITGTANKQFINGDINYLEWVLLVNQAVSIQSDYIEAVKNRNASAVEINSFITK